jgi:hypothetical protein
MTSETKEDILTIMLLPFVATLGVCLGTLILAGYGLMKIDQAVDDFKSWWYGKNKTYRKSI